MAAAIVHRGPDDAGYLERETVSLGHRRLSIIDREGGHQPMANEDETVWLVYNGEIYNYRELRVELEGAGHIFRTQLRQRGHRPRLRGVGPGLRGALQRHVGVRRRRLSPAEARRQARPEPRPLRHQAALLRPLPESGRLLFASEIKALLQDPELPPSRTSRWSSSTCSTASTITARGRSSAACTTCRRRPGSRCPLGGAGEVGAAQAATARDRAGHPDPPLTSAAYWSPELRSDASADPADFRRRFRDSVERRLVCEVPGRLVPLGRPRLDHHRQLYERAAQGGRARRGFPARPAQDFQRGLRRRPNRRARVHRDRRREHRRRHHLHQPHLARVRGRTARLHLAPGRADRQHRSLRAVVRDALGARAGDRAPRRAGRGRTDRRLRALPARLPAAAAQGASVRGAAPRGGQVARRAVAAGQRRIKQRRKDCRRRRCSSRRSSRARATPATGAPRTTSRSACSRTCSRTASRACFATRTATPWPSASRAGCRTSTRSWSTTS